MLNQRTLDCQESPVAVVPFHQAHQAQAQAQSCQRLSVEKKRQRSLQVLRGDCLQAVHPGLADMKHFQHPELRVLVVLTAALASAEATLASLDRLLEKLGLQMKALVILARQAAVVAESLSKVPPFRCGVVDHNPATMTPVPTRGYPENKKKVELATRRMRWSKQRVREPPQGKARYCTDVDSSKVGQ